MCGGGRFCLPSFKWKRGLSGDRHFPGETVTHTKMTKMASVSHRLCFVLGLHSEALPSSWDFQWYNVQARSTEVGLEEGIKDAARRGDDGKLHPGGSS